MSNWERVMVPAFLLTIDPGARAWQRECDDGGHLSVFRTRERRTPDGPFRTHLSVSHRVPDGFGGTTPGRYPTWDEQKEVVHRFAPGLTMVSYILPEGDPEWVNVHPTTFHWHEDDR